MAFKSMGPAPSVPDSPEKLLLELPRRKIPSVLLHQGETMRTYASNYVGSKDVAIQLPTGSGKTLVALLIAEWRRRRGNERIVYLCPTKQLVNQVVYQANEVYGLDVQGFTGPKSEYTAAAKASYQTASKIAITTYSSLFNVSPFFSDPDIIIIDDAHASESYLAAMWTISVQREEHASLHRVIMHILRPIIGEDAYARACGDFSSIDSLGWVDKVPSMELIKVVDQITAAFDVHTQETALRFQWQLLREHLLACHIYINDHEIYLRPLIPPSWTHRPFSSAKQRIYMSATLGAGGDLERLTGVRIISRLPVPDGWSRQGVGRRFFILPDLSLDQEDVPSFTHSLIKEAGRAAYLVSNDVARRRIERDISEKLSIKTFTATDIEETKKPFITSPSAVAVIANRYDGIDFPGVECRLLLIEGLPRAANPQELFLMSRMAAGVLLNERVQTRFLQAIGRCTRSAEDYSAVVIIGEQLTDFVSDGRRKAFFHPELQAEIAFGINQSTETTRNDMLDNFRTFLANDKDWEAANQQILTARDEATQEPLPSIGQLEAGVGDELRYQSSMWQEDFVTALSMAEAVLSNYTDPGLRGYRALWHYLAGSAAELATKFGQGNFDTRALEHFRKAKAAATMLPWLVKLAGPRLTSTEAPPSQQQLVAEQVERLESYLIQIGLSNERRYAAVERDILEGLGSPEHFEQAHLKLGLLLGFEARKVEEDASPDPWWRSSGICLVFEDHAGAENGIIDATKARQAASHPAWIRANAPDITDAVIAPVLITPATQAQPGAIPSLAEVYLWPLDEFRTWANDALAIIRHLRQSCPREADIDWRARAVEVLKEHGLDAHSLHAKLIQRKASSLPIVGRV